MLNVDDVPAQAAARDGRGPLDPVAPRAAPREEITALLESYQFSRAALALYDVLWGEVCDWYLELVKPRLYEEGADEAALSANLLHVARAGAEAAAPDDAVRHRGDLVVPARRARPAGGVELARAPTGRDRPEAEGAGRAPDRGGAGVRRWRDDVGVAAATRVRARLAADGYEQTPEHLARSRGSSCPAASERRRRGLGAIPGGACRCWPPTRSTPRRRSAAARRGASSSSRRSRAREGKLANEQFVRRRPRRWCRPSARSSTRCARSSRSWASEPAPGRGVPARPRAVRHALRARPHAQADDRAGHAAAALRLDPRGGHQRQVLDRAHDRRASSSATGCARAATPRRTCLVHRARARSASSRCPAATSPPR